MHRHRLPWLLVLVVMLGACAADPPPPPAAPVVVATDDPQPPYNLLGKPHAIPRDGYVVQEERPEGCAGSDQPAVVSRTASRTVWQCFEGCGPGLEYVSGIKTSGRGPDGTAVRCTPLCEVGTHRSSPVSWVDQKARCIPGDPSSAAAQSQATDQARQLSACIDARREALATSEEEVGRAEQNPTLIDAAEDHLQAIKQMCEGRNRYGAQFFFDHDPVVAERERVLAVAAPELDATSRLLSARLEAARHPVRNVVDLQKYAAVAQRSLAPCYRGCDATRSQCRTACATDPTWGACDKCDRPYEECRTTCWAK